MAKQAVQTAQEALEQEEEVHKGLRDELVKLDDAIRGAKLKSVGLKAPAGGIMQESKVCSSPPSPRRWTRYWRRPASWTWPWVTPPSRRCGAASYGAMHKSLFRKQQRKPARRPMLWALLLPQGSLAQLEIHGQGKKKLTWTGSARTPRSGTSAARQALTLTVRKARTMSGDWQRPFSWQGRNCVRANLRARQRSEKSYRVGTGDAQHVRASRKAENGIVFKSKTKGKSIDSAQAATRAQATAGKGLEVSGQRQVRSGIRGSPSVSGQALSTGTKSKQASWGCTVLSRKQAGGPEAARCCGVSGHRMQCGKLNAGLAVAVYVISRHLVLGTGGMDGENAGTLSSQKEFLSKLQTPWLRPGYWNMEPEEAGSWASRLGGAVFRSHAATRDQREQDFGFSSKIPAEVEVGGKLQVTQTAKAQCVAGERPQGKVLDGEVFVDGSGIGSKERRARARRQGGQQTGQGEVRAAALVGGTEEASAAQARATSAASQEARRCCRSGRGSTSEAWVVPRGSRAGPVHASPKQLNGAQQYYRQTLLGIKRWEREELSGSQDRSNGASSRAALAPQRRSRRGHGCHQGRLARGAGGHLRVAGQEPRAGTNGGPAARQELPARG